jgi:hypothetical protein
MRLEDVVMHMPRLLTLAVIVFTFAAAPAPAGSMADDVETCGLSIHVQDPGLRATFARFDRNQSAAAARACALYRNEVPAILAVR